MAPPIATRPNERGSALIEAIGVSSLLVTMASTLLLGSYLVLARVWLNYQSEQLLYCEAERQMRCREKTKDDMQRVLPWGELTAVHTRVAGLTYDVEMTWTFNGINFRTRKSLDLKLIARKRDLHW